MSEQAMTEQVDVSADFESIQLLTFVLDNETYGVDISQIQEVLEHRSITRVPRTPDFMLGVINLRGNVVPVVDLRKQFGMNVSDVTVDTCIVIVDLVIDGENTALGVLADAVSEVLSLNADVICQPPRIGNRVDTEFIRGMGRKDDEFVIILDLTRVFSASQITDLVGSVQDLAPASGTSESDPVALTA